MSSSGAIPNPSRWLDADHAWAKYALALSVANRK